jgi:two-component system, OmpR family, phosphate regulon response regulator PhoB
LNQLKQALKSTDVNKKTVLIIEDDEFIRNLLAHVLQKEGYNVLLAGDFRSSIKIIDSSPLDMIISDVMLPYTGGLEILEYIKSNEHQKHIPVILVTAMDKDVLNCSHIKAEAIVTKPFDTGHLLDVVKNNINRSKPN